MGLIDGRKDGSLITDRPAWVFKSAPGRPGALSYAPPDGALWSRSAPSKPWADLSPHGEHQTGRTSHPSGARDLIHPEHPRSASLGFKTALPLTVERHSPLSWWGGFSLGDGIGSTDIERLQNSILWNCRIAKTTYCFLKLYP